MMTRGEHPVTSVYVKTLVQLYVDASEMLKSPLKYLEEASRHAWIIADECTTDARQVLEEAEALKRAVDKLRHDIEDYADANL